MIVLLLGSLLALAGSVGLAQETEDPGPNQPQGEVSISAAVSSKFSYQGVLKEDGDPVTGDRDMTFRLYTDEACTAQSGSDIVKSDVEVTDGLFSVELEVTHDDIDGRGLWLGAEVGGTTIGCQEILRVPYALSLRPGAVISGTDPALTAQTGTGVGELGTVKNVGLVGPAVNHDVGAYGSGDTGVYGYSPDDTGVRGRSGGATGFGVSGMVSSLSGTNYGVYGSTMSADGYGGYFMNLSGGTAVKAHGPIQSTSTSYLWVPGDEMQMSTDVSRIDIVYGWSGSATIRPNDTGNAAVVIPITIPGVLYGQEVTVVSARVYYKVDNTGDSIYQTLWRKSIGPGDYEELAIDETIHASATATSYDLIADEEYRVLDPSSGGLVMVLKLRFDGTGRFRDILVGGVRVALEHD